MEWNVWKNMEWKFGQILNKINPLREHNLRMDIELVMQSFVLSLAVFCQRFLLCLIISMIFLTLKCCIKFSLHIFRPFLNLVRSTFLFQCFCTKLFVFALTRFKNGLKMCSLNLIQHFKVKNIIEIIKNNKKKGKTQLMIRQKTALPIL